MSRESKPFLRRRHAAQLFKTEICKFFLEGRCESGEACSYAHEEEEVRNKPDLTRTSMCRNFLRDGACNNKRCRFAHSEEELRATNGFFKMKMCLFAQSGKCKSGSRCRFAHTTDELRPARLCEEDEALNPDAVPAEQEQRMEQESQIDLYSLSSFPERQKSSQQESHGTGGSTATGNSGSTSGNGGSTSGNASGQSSNENSGSGHSPRGKEASESRPRGRALQQQQARMRKENDNSDKSDESSASGNSSATVVPRSEHGSTASPPASDSSSYGACGTGERTEASGHSQPGETKEQTKKVSRRPQSKRRGKNKADKDFQEEDFEVTTLIISNLPLYLTQGALLSFFQDLTTNMRGKFDFFYSPWDHEAGHSFGYAVINFTDEQQAGRFYHQWTDKDLFGSGRGSKPHPPLKVAKASLQGQQKNIDYFNEAGIGRCADVRFCPLYRDAEGNMKHFELAGDVESQPTKDGVQPKAFQEGLGPQDLETGQETVTGAAASKGASCEPATSGASRPEEHQAREEATTRRPRRRNNRRRAKENQEKETITAPEAAQVPPAEFPTAARPQSRAMPGSGVQPDMRQLALRQQHQQLLKDLEEKEERKRNKNQNSQETSSGRSQNGMIPEMSQLQLHEAQQLQMLLMQLQQFQSSAQQMIGSCSSMTSCMNDTFPQAAMTPSTAPGQFMVSRVPMGVRDSGQMAMHMARHVNQLPVNEQVASNYTPDPAPAVAGLPCANAPMGPIVPCVMLPVQSMPVQSLQAPPMAASGSFNGSGGLRLLSGDEVYTD